MRPPRGQHLWVGLLCSWSHQRGSEAWHPDRSHLQQSLLIDLLFYLLQLLLGLQMHLLNESLAVHKSSVATWQHRSRSVPQRSSETRQKRYTEMLSLSISAQQAAHRDVQHCKQPLPTHQCICSLCQNAPLASVDVAQTASWRQSVCMHQHCVCTPHKNSRCYV
jgi:hypothetical protein